MHQYSQRPARSVRVGPLTLAAATLICLPLSPLQAARSRPQDPSAPELVLPASPPQSTTDARRGSGRKIGLVLSGGSARGLAHVGVIRVLEEAGLEFDVVTGTSIGAIIGGLYSTGYTPDQMLSVAAAADWDHLFSDLALRRNLPVERKPEVDRLAFALPIRRGKPRLPGGFIAGQHIGQFLTLLTWRVHPVRDFRTLPLPFAAVATDAETGNAVRLENGYLPNAIRASTAIPSVFAPVEVDGRLLIDGGVARNLPAEDAQALGAEVLICSDVSKPLMPADSLDNLLAVLDQTIGYRSWESTLKQRERCDVLILPDIAGLSSTAFDRAREWAERGDAAARAALAEVAELGLASGPPPSPPEPDARRLGPATPTATASAESAGVDPYADSVYIADLAIAGLRTASQSFVRDRLRIIVPGWVRLSDLDAGVTRLYDTGRFLEVQYLLDDIEKKEASGAPALGETSQAAGLSAERILQLIVVEERFARLGFGYRYDSRYKAALLASAVAFDVLGYGTRVEADVRLGEQGLAEGRLTRRVGHTPEFLVGVDIGYRRMPFDIYQEGLRAGSPRAYVTHLSLGAGLAIGNAAVLGVRIKGEHADLDEFAVVGEPFTGESRSYATVSALFGLDSYDRAVFPRTGARALLKSEYRFAGDDGSFVHSVLDAEGAVPLLDQLSLLGRLTVGTSSVDVPDHYHFFLGGTNSYFIFPDRHFPFSGLKALERYGRHVQSLQLGVQYEFHRYVVGRFRWSAGAALDEWDVDLDLLTYGYDLTFAAVTRFGSAAISLAGLDLASLPRLVVDVGFPF